MVCFMGVVNVEPVRERKKKIYRERYTEKERVKVMQAHTRYILFYL